MIKEELVKTGIAKYLGEYNAVIHEYVKYTLLTSNLVYYKSAIQRCKNGDYSNFPYIDKEVVIDYDFSEKVDTDFAVISKKDYEIKISYGLFCKLPTNLIEMQYANFPGNNVEIRYTISIPFVQGVASYFTLPAGNCGGSLPVITVGIASVLCGEFTELKVYLTSDVKEEMVYSQKLSYIMYEKSNKKYFEII